MGDQRSAGRPDVAAATRPLGPGHDPRGDPVRTCPNCGAPLDDRSCKLICPTPSCGYYLSCADYY